MPDTIKWTKHYDLRHQAGNFRIFCSEHTAGGFYASILYFQKKPSASVTGGDWGLLDFKHKTMFGESETEALEALKRWLAGELPGNYTLEPSAP